MFSTKNAVTKSSPKLLSILRLLLLLGSLTRSFKAEEEAGKDKVTEVVLEEPTTSLTYFFNGNSCSKNSAFLDSQIELSFKHKNLYAALF